MNRFLSIAFSPRTDGQIELVSSAFPESHRFWTSRLVHHCAAPWADVVKGMLTQLRRRGVHFSGYNAAIYSSIPTSLGLGCSAALAIGTGLTIRQLFPYSLTEQGAGVPPPRDRRGRLPPLSTSEKRYLAQTCQAAESEFLGTAPSVTAAISSLLNRAHHLTAIDHRFETIGQVPLIGEALVICDSGVRPEPGHPGHADILEHCELAARALRARSLRSVDLAWLKKLRTSLNHREFECACHVVGEIHRTVFAERALREDDHHQFGQYLFQSHESSRQFIGNSCPELDLLVELARARAGCLGSRLTGRGFGGATVNVVAFHHLEDFTRRIAEKYQALTGRQIRPAVCQVVDGAA